MQLPWVLSHLKSSHQIDKVCDLETSLLIHGKNQRVGRRWVGTIAHWTTGLACIGLDSPKLPQNALFSARQVGESSKSRFPGPVIAPTQLTLMTVVE